MSKLIVTPSPHLRQGDTTKGIMLDVIIALIPAVIASVIYFGWRAFMLVCVCVVSCVLTEYVSRKIMKRNNTVGDLSAVVTGIILAMNLPAMLNPLYAVIGSVIAIAVVKQMFGGLGQNFVNPALAARIILMLSFPTAMSTWVMPFSADAVTGATPLAGADISVEDLFIGNHGGCLGETCALALILGGIYLVARGVISTTIPLTFIATVAVGTLIAGGDPLKAVLSGGIMLGAIFMATDYVTSPITYTGKLIFGIGCGILTVIIRNFGAMPEGVSFAILFMNILVPHIEKLTKPRPFGEERRKK